MDYKFASDFEVNVGLGLFSKQELKLVFTHSISQLQLVLISLEFKNLTALQYNKNDTQSVMTVCK